MDQTENQNNQAGLDQKLNGAGEGKKELTLSP